MPEQTDKVLISNSSCVKRDFSRPIYISIICVIGILLSIANISLRGYGLIVHLPSAEFSFDLTAIIISIIELIAFILIWRMIRAGTYIYLLAFAFTQGWLFYLGLWSYIGFTFQAVVILIFIFNLKRMV